MESHWLLVLLVLSSADERAQAQQCTTSALPSVIEAIGGDVPPQADGVWYGYRVMGRPTVTNSRIQFNTLGQIIEPLSSLPASLQWRVTAQQPSSSACQNQFWTGMYMNTGKEIGDEGTSDDGHIMRPNYYTVLHHDYQSLMVHYGCPRPAATTNGLCAAPVIFADTRQRPDQLSATELAALDATINSIFAKYCVTVDKIPRNIFTDSAPFCPFVDPPPCVAQDIRGMQNSIRTGSGNSSQPGPGSSYSASTASPGTCKWPLSIVVGNTDPSVVAGDYYMWRYKFAPEQNPVNQLVRFTNIGPAVSPLTTITARMYTVQYSNYEGQTSSQCVNGFPFFAQGSNGINNGMIVPWTTAGAPQPLTITTLVGDGATVLYYGCEAPNLQTGQCDMPTVVHMFRSNPLEMSQADKDAADALEDSFFSRYGCSAKKDDPAVVWTKDKPLCPFVDAPECLQKHITGYLQTVQSTVDTAPKY